LLNNPGVQAWTEKFLDCNYTTNVLCHDHLQVREMDLAQFDLVHRQCQLLISQLSQFGFVYQGPDISTVNHTSLNCVHRFFTHNQQRCNNREFGNDFDYLSVMRMLDKLNLYVHELELYIARGPEDIPVDQIEEIKLYQSTDYNSDGWCSLADYQQYHSDQHHDVILSSEILGKTLLQSYLDQDDPSDWDTSGHYSSAGSLQITYLPTRQTIYQSHSFQQWLQQHQVAPDRLCYDFPIGNIQDRDTGSFQQVLQKLQHCRHDEVSVIYKRKP
jgi:hypothetical protein